MVCLVASETLYCWLYISITSPHHLMCNLCCNVSLRGGRGRPSKGDAFTIAEEYRRRKKMVRQEEIAKARKLTKMINESESTAANPTHLVSLACGL